MTFAKGLEVLAAFDAEDRELTIPEVARKTNLNRTVARRLVLTLEHLNYLECNNRVYRLTPRILRLAGGFLQGRDIGKHVSPILATYSEKLKGSVSFAMLDGNEAVYVAHSPGDPRMITLGFTVGSRLPLHATAIGRALVAFSGWETRERLLEVAPRVKYTCSTKIDLDDLRDDLDLSVRNGFVYVQDEFEQGVASLAVPVKRPDGALIGSLGIVGPNPRFSNEKNKLEKVRLLHECAGSIAMIV
ncbi:IclR family transcriptional regulator [Sneathiella chinensis]|uniref:IclR family transcriptional regulator n=1 Tax=Sneathiella chinensis TaxID=349750 RepID=A0ABQ5U3Q8_9PROT|nr:IclR family transcriptional regulator C-terminal domain-containing protein [Sneathiella chinensis]GLQ05919.1 IclR family transcriptional regulator [Sneathiella chinensis]